MSERPLIPLNLQQAPNKLAMDLHHVPELLVQDCHHKYRDILQAAGRQCGS